MKANWTGKLWIGMLGAINGAVYSATMLLIIWRVRALADERNMAQGAISGDYINLVSHERWSSIIIIWLVAFTLASLVVSSLWRKHQRGSILFWEVIGVMAVAAWNGFALLGSVVDKYYSGGATTYGWVTSLRNPLHGPISFAVVILVNFAYGYLVQALCRKLKPRYEADLRRVP